MECRCNSQAARLDRRLPAPTTAIFLGLVRSGNNCPSFLSKTMDSCAASNASFWCAGDCTSSIPIVENGTSSGGSNMPSRNRTTNKRSKDRLISSSLLVRITAVQVCSRLHGFRGCLRQGTRVMKSGIGVVDCIAIADHVTLEAPRVAKLVFQKKRTGTRRRSIHAVVRTHERVHPPSATVAWKA
jgi:hypothetical protein